MEFEDIANLVNRVAIERKGRPLKDVERLVLEGAWHNQTYATMAQQAGGYTEDYLKKDVGPKLWRLLSDLIDHQGIKVTKRNIQNVLQHWAIQTLEQVSPVVSPPPPALVKPPQQNLPRRGKRRPPIDVWASSRLDLSDFWGRQQDVSRLQSWLQEEACRSILLWGLPGVGKTTLATKVLEHLAPEIETCGYLSLATGVDDGEFFAALVAWLRSEGKASLTLVTDSLTWIMQQLERRRCVLLIDQVEELFQPGQLAGTYRPGTEGIQQFFQLVAEQPHQSSIVWVSREKPVDLSQVRGGQVREYQLNDLSVEDVKGFLQRRGLQAVDENWQILFDRYGGNPLLLKGLTATVQEVYQGQVAPFLKAPDLALPTIFREDLEQALTRLAIEEDDILYWLAIAHEPVPLLTLTDRMIPTPSAMAIQSLLGRSLCYPVASSKETGTCLRLNPMVQSIALGQLRSLLIQELRDNRFERLNRLPMVVVTARESVQQQQRQALLLPLTEELQQLYPTESKLAAKFQQLHQTLHHNCLGQPGYGAGNFIHLCQSLGLSISGADFAELTIWQSDLRHVSLQGANLSHAKFSDTIFATALGRHPVMAFSLDSEYLATGDHEGRLLLWKLKSGRLVRVLDDGMAQGISCLAFSPQGELLAVGTDSGQIWLWSLQGSYHPDGLFDHQTIVLSLAFSPDGSRLASGDAAGHLCLWDVASGLVQGHLLQHQGPIHSLAFDDQGQYLVSGGEDQRACLWDGVQQVLVKEFQAGPTAQIRAAGFLADPQWPHGPSHPVAAGYDEQSLTLWDIQADRALWAVPINGQAILAMALNPNSQDLICSYQDFSVTLWHVVHRQIRYSLPTFNAPVWTVAFSANGEYFATSGDYMIQIWETANGDCFRSLLSQAHPVRCLAFTCDGHTMLTGHNDQTLRLWQLNGANTFTACPGQLSGHTAAVRGVAVSQDGHWWASSAEDLTIRLWQSSTGHCERVMAPLSLPANLMAFSPDSRWLVSAGEDSAVALWEVATGFRVGNLKGDDSPASALVFCPNNASLLSGGRDGEIRLWDIPQGQCRQILKGHQGQVHSLALSQQGTILASASHDGSLRWWNLDQAEELGRWRHPHGQWLQAVTISPADEILAITSQSYQVEIWEVKSNRRRHQLAGHSHDIWQVEVSSDKTTLATASQDDEIRLWRLDSGTCLQVLHPDRPYEGVNILGADGLSEPEATMLKALGAVVSCG